MFKNIAKAIGGNPQKREIERLSFLVAEINKKEAEFNALSNEALRGKTAFFKEQLSSGKTLEDILVEVYAAVRETSKRTIGLRHFNVQMIGGVAMHNGLIIEMRTGEGKTLVATLPLYLNALIGKGVHLVTVNDYLARRDARWMAPIYHFLGLSVGVLQSRRTDSGLSGYIVDLDSRSIKEEDDQLRMVPRVQAYAADITYGTNNEFGFDYLRDNLIMDLKNRVQRGHHYAIIDEVDNILIDEARTPLIISGPASEDVKWYSKMAVVVKHLDPEDYDFDEKDRSIALTEIGEIHVEELLQIPLRDPDRPEDITPEQARLLGYLEQALRAELLYRKNKDYIVKNNEVIIVDEFTGRLMAGRRWSEGLHQAVEAKEGVKVNPENVTHATITLQNFFRKYEKLSGMTGTALTEAEEFSTIYSLGVLEIPTNLDFEAGQPNSTHQILQAKDEEGYTYTYYAQKNDLEKIATYWKRKDYPDVVYRTEEAKLRAICLEVIKFNIIGRPQLIGTTSIEHSERLSSRLQTNMIRRLLTINLIRQKWMENNDIEFLDHIVPELSPLNTPLDTLRPAELRQNAHSIGVQSIQLENDENLAVLINFLNLPNTENSRKRLTEIIQGGIQHQVLNALKHDRESQIIEGAGAYRSVTIATNMAGRGVDIKLGGEIKETVLSDIRRILTESDIDPYGMTNQEMAEKIRTLGNIEQDETKGAIDVFLDFLENMAKVREAGGLHVIGSERHEARRIDNQLRGRSGRQGDPGSSRFYLSLEDDLMRMFGGERAENMMRLFNLDPSVPLESRIIGRLVEQAQERVEGYNFDIRKHLLDYDDILNNQRERIYSERNQVLVKKDLKEDVWGMLENEIIQRATLSFDDPVDGSWKLLAFLDEVQPTQYYQSQNTRLLSYTIGQVEAYANQQINDHADFDAVKTVLTDIAKQTLLAQKNYLVRQTQDFIQRSVDTYTTQRKERIQMLDLFFDTLNEGEGLSVQETNAQLQKSVRLKIRLDQIQYNALLQRDSKIQKQLRDKASSLLKQVFLSRIFLTIEQRIQQKLLINIEDLLNEKWNAISNRITKVIEDRFHDSADLPNQPNHPVIQNMGRILKHQLGADGSGLIISEILIGMAIGTQVAFNQQTHQRTRRRVNMLNYVFFAAENILPDNPDTLAKSLIDHLSTSQDELQNVWGKMEMRHIAESNMEYNNLSAAYKESTEKMLDDASKEKLYNTPVSSLLAEDNSPIIQAFGGRVQQIIYRHILLQSISELWIEHLTRMEALRVSIRMEAYAQRDPLVQYKSYSTDTFKELLANIRLSVVGKMFRMQPAKPKTELPGNNQQPKITDTQVQNQQKKKKSRKRHKKK